MRFETRDNALITNELIHFNLTINIVSLLKSAFWLKILGFLCLFLAIMSSVQNAANVLWSNEIVENQLFIFTRAFLAHLLVRTPIQILFSLFLFLFSSFVEKASIVKQENESFI